MDRIFTSESVTLGHPDKLCDYVADSILDSLLAKDPMSRVACEVSACYDTMNIFGEITSSADIDYDAVARKAVRDAGYVKDEYIFTDKCKINFNLHRQSQEISNAVSHADGDIGAGDQGLMFGYACRETGSYMPFAIDAAHMLTKKLTKLRESGEIPYLRPDGKSQVSALYDGNGNVKGISAIVLSAQTDNVEPDRIKSDIMTSLILPNFDSGMLKQTKFFINPSGSFVLGGPAGDSGLTGRKIIVDTYGGYAHHGGGAFSGKDATKVDRSVTYMLRRIAKNVVYHNMADRCEIQAAYSIGVCEPVSLMVDTFGTSRLPENVIVDKIKSFYSLKPADIIDFLDLRKPVFAATDNGGAFGNDLFDATWEKIDDI